MDHAGAVVGPVLASLFLYFYPGSYRTLFALAIVPGAVSIALILLVREGEAPAVDPPIARGSGGHAIGSGPPCAYGSSPYWRMRRSGNAW